MNKKLVIIIGVIFSIVITIFTFYYYRISTRNAVETMVVQKKMIHVLVAGSNTFRDNKHRFFAIVSINPENSSIGITFIPPSYRITDDDGEDPERIDSIEVYNFNEIRHALKRDLKLHIPFFMELYSSDVERIVDLIEGVNIFVLDSIEGMPGLAFGLNYLDGEKLVQYINSVYQNSIYLKYDRIMNILLSLYSHRNEKSRMNHPELVEELFKEVKTNILPQEANTLLNLVLKEGTIRSTVLPGKMEGGFYVIDDITRAIYEKQFLARLVVGQEIDPVVKVRILNGTEVTGLARRMRNVLIRDGLNVVEFGNSPYPKMEHSILVNRKGDCEGVKKTSEFTGITKIYHVLDSSQLSSVLVILGKDLAKQ